MSAVETIELVPFNQAGMGLSDALQQSIPEQIASRSVHETDFEYFSNVRAEDSVFIDVGPNIGNSAVSISNRCEGARIYGFEPNLILESLLREAKSHNPNFSVQMIGLGETEAEFNLFIPVLGSTLIVGESSLLRDHFDSAFVQARLRSYGPNQKLRLTSVKCQISTLDAQAAIFEAAARARWRFLKIDVEGAELSVLKGATAFITRFRPTLLIEEGHRAELAQFLVGYGYSRYMLDRAGNRLVEACSATTLNSFYQYRPKL